MRKKYLLQVTGKEHEWAFEVEVDAENAQDYADDGLILFEIKNTIPSWVADLGLLRPWCFVQDIFYFKNPFKH